MSNLNRQRETRQAAADVVTLERGPSTPLSVGEQLRLSRERFDLQIEEVADYLKIRRQHLNAIEEGRIEDLPGHAYAVGFVRAYAEYLGLDTGTIVERFKDETAEPDEQSRLVFPSPMPEGRTPGGALVLIAVVGVAVVYGAWIYLSAQDRSLAEIVPALPAAMQKLVGSDSTTPASETVKTANPESSVPPMDTTSTDAASAARLQTSPTPVGENSASVTGSSVTVRPVTRSELSEPEIETPKIEAKTVVPTVPDTLATSTAPLNEIGEVAPIKVAPIKVMPAPSTGAPVLPENETTSAVLKIVPDEAAPKIVVIPPVEVPAPVSHGPVINGPVINGDDLNIPASASQRSEFSTASASVANTLDTIDIPESVGTSAATGAQSVLPPSPPAETQSGPRQFGVNNANSRITIVALVDSWVEIRDGEGALLLTRLLKTGDSY
ncbi:MAG: cytoskeletal protein RodZ, partial [Alphaproteobacteria bacterium]